MIRGDICDSDSVLATIEGVARVIHLAALVGDWGTEEAFRRVTVGGTENVLGAAAAAGVRAAPTAAPSKHRRRLRGVWSVTRVCE